MSGHVQDTFPSRARVLIEFFYFRDLPRRDETSQIGFDHRPFHLPILPRRFPISSLDCPCFPKRDARLMERLCQLRAKTRVGSLLFQRNDLPFPETFQTGRFIHPRGIIRFSQCKEMPAGFRHALHFKHGLQRIVNPQ